MEIQGHLNSQFDPEWGQMKEAFFQQEASDLVYSKSSFNPAHFFIPGWKGEGLITTHGLTIKTCLNNLTIDASSQLRKLNATPSMRKLVFDEFVSFANSISLPLEAFKTQTDFQFHLQDDTSPYTEHLQNFLKMYSFRAVAVYLFRMKFIIDLARELELELTDDTLLNPLSFLNKIFKKASSTELNCSSLQINQYSWYRPSHEYVESLLKLEDAFLNVTPTELLKLLSTNNENKVYSVRNYSHSLSHISFGHFLNKVLIKLPQWINPVDDFDFKNINSLKKNDSSFVIPKVLTTKFEGQHVASLALSHWLAQEDSAKLPNWDHIICPEFKSNDHFDGQFLNICHELQFLSFLTKFAVLHNYELVPFICKVFKERSKSMSSDHGEQISFLNLNDDGHCTKFKRIILNLAESPKTNPHHHLVTQILSQSQYLKNDGVLVVLSNQKLFVPSHSERVELLLKTYKVLSLFELDELKGKGEIPQYIYCLSLRHEGPHSKQFLLNLKSFEKESCSSFKIRGDLSRFNKFNQIVSEFSQFFKTRKLNSTPIYAVDLDEELSLEFHQDAIIEGKLVSSVNEKDQLKQTHPAFFKNLTKSSVSLETFFQIEHIDPLSEKQKNHFTSELLGLRINYLEQHPILLIVNQSNSMQVEIELVPFDSLKAKVEQYGTAFFTYFGLKPKHAAINLNVFREYFASSLGQQIIALQLSDGPTKIKGKVKSLLIPAFFTETHFMNSNEALSFSLLEKEAHELLKLHPDDLNVYFSHVETKSQLLKKKYPWHLLGLLSQFKIQLNNSLSLDSNQINNDEVFSNPLVIQKLLSLKSQVIYPRHDDLYVDILAKSPSDLHSQLTHFSLETKSDEDLMLTLFSGQKSIVAFYSHPKMLKFIKFILQNATGAKISDILLGLRIPKLTELEATLKEFEQIRENENHLLERTQKIIQQIFIEQVSCIQ